MNKGWLELESDPGLFTLLLEEFGVQGVQVEEIYDLQKAVEGPVYGFIFLFKWIEERRARRKTTQEDETFVMDENIVNSMFFAQQIIPNSCATHALLSVMLNCKGINLGESLTKLKQFSEHMGPEEKGYAIGNMPDIARAHNGHARPEPCQLPEKQQGIAAVRTAEAFHFVSYVPINGRLFELDGLKPYPIDHGPWGEHEDWTEQFRRVITERLGMATNGGEPYHDIRFNLMAVVPDRRQVYEQKLKTLKTNRQIILETLQQKLKERENTMVKVTAEGDSPRSRHRHKAEPIVTRSVAAKTGDGPVRSTRLREKAAAAAAAHTDPMATMVRSPPELDSHNYAKSPDMMDVEGLTHDTIEEKAASQETIEKFEKQQLQSVKNSDVKIQISVSDDKEGSVMPTTVASTDITKPLIIQTKFGNLPAGPGTGSSTDTASEVGSCLSSPVCSTGQPSPNLRAAVTGMIDSKAEMSEKALIAAARNLQTKLEEDANQMNNTEVKGEAGEKPTGLTNGTSPEGGNHKKSRSSAKFGSHAFTPKDLLQLLKNVESEITACEGNLRDEVDKRNKYKIDACRRTHNYDQFICTFLSMLAEQGHLAALVEHNMLGKRRPASVAISALNKTAKKPDKRKKPKGKKKK